MKVIEIFHSIEGEGKRAGLPATFIRLYGCNLRCYYCDTEYSYNEEAEKNFRSMTAEEIVEECDRIGCPTITVTGGEPLVHPGIKRLLEELLDAGYDVNVETNGTIPPPLIPRMGNIFYTMDYKLGSSGMSDSMDMVITEQLTDEDVLKFVVGSQDDLHEAMAIAKKMTDNSIECPQIYFSPVFGAIEPADIVRFIKDHKLWFAKVQLQLHKFIWPPEQRGV